MRMVEKNLKSPPILRINLVMTPTKTEIVETIAKQNG